MMSNVTSIKANFEIKGLFISPIARSGQ